MAAAAPTRSRRGGGEKSRSSEMVVPMSSWRRKEVGKGKEDNGNTHSIWARGRKAGVRWMCPMCGVPVPGWWQEERDGCF